VYSPSYIDGMSITLDYWRFKVTDAIARADVQVGLDACHGGDAEACSTFNITADGDLFNLTSALTNVGSQDTSGVDFNLAYNFELLGLDWKVSNDTTYLIKFEQDGENYTGTIDGNMGAYARVRNNFSISAGQDDWSVMYFNRYIRSMTDVYTDYDANDNPFVAVRGVDSILYHNISGTYHVNDSTTVSLGVKNFTDEKPLYVTNGSDAGTVPEVYDTIGRTIYGGVTVKF
jgi:iron complex outermembrane receptor protein